MTDQTPSTEQVRDPMSGWLEFIIGTQLKPWDPPNHERLAAIRAEWEADLAARDREVAANAIRRLARNLDTAMLFMNIDEEQALSDAMLDHADRIEAGDE